MRCGTIACGCYANRRKRVGFPDVAPNGAGELGGLCVATRMSPSTGLYRFCPDWGILRCLRENLAPKARSGKRGGFPDVALDRAILMLPRLGPFASFAGNLAPLAQKSVKPCSKLPVPANKLVPATTCCHTTKTYRLQPVAQVH